VKAVNNVQPLYERKKNIGKINNKHQSQSTDDQSNTLGLKCC